MKWLNAFIIYVSIVCIACNLSTQKKDQQHLFASHYDLNKPEVFKMPKELNEISGITFLNGNADTMYAEQDEEGKVFRFALGNNNINKTRFGSKGDYEDIAILNGYIILLRSDGNLFVFPLRDINTKEITDTKEFKNLLPSGEYEGLYADNKQSKLYVLCKACKEDHKKKTSVYMLSMDNNGNPSSAGNSEINVRSIAEKMDVKKIVFHPSALAKNEHTGEWFILSSVNHCIVLTSADFTVKEVISLNTSLYNQPEGIAFDTAGNLYISNEKGNTNAATVLKIMYKQ